MTKLNMKMTKKKVSVEQERKMLLQGSRQHLGQFYS